MPTPTPHDTVTTIEELLALPDDGLRHELLDGVHVVTPAPELPHQAILRRLFSVLDRGLQAADDLELFWGPADVVLGPRTLACGLLGFADSGA
ncbi:MAG: Uma2 family endonuclease [Candidatus Eiseniibacteriota bacterium]